MLLLYREIQDVNKMISDDLIPAPYIVGFGGTQDYITDVKIEKETVVSFSSVSEALHYYFATYYIFNISYPSDFKAIMLETQVYGLKFSSKEPLMPTVFKDNLQRFCSETINDEQ